jgi:hypothetical protein
MRSIRNRRSLLSRERIAVRREPLNCERIVGPPEADSETALWEANGGTCPSNLHFGNYATTDWFTV